jgi:glutamate 5-kinase
VIAAASRDEVLADAVAGVAGVGTVIAPRSRRLAARKLWIAFALPASGVVTVDAGARRALEERGTSLLPVGVIHVAGDFDPGDAVEVAGPDGSVFAKGIARLGAAGLRAVAGTRGPVEAVHRDELVLVH